MSQEGSQQSAQEPLKNHEKVAPKIDTKNRLQDKDSVMDCPGAQGMTRGESQGPRRGGRAPRGSSAPIPSFLGPLDFPLALPWAPRQSINIMKPADGILRDFFGGPAALSLA